MLYLTSTSHVLEARLETDSTVDTYVSYVDCNASSATEGSEQNSATTAGTWTMCSSPGSGLARVVKSAWLLNRGTTPVGVRVQVTTGGGTFQVSEYVTLRPGDAWHYEDARGWYFARATDQETYSGRQVQFFKTGTGADTVGYHYCFAKDAGFPGAWSPGTPGLGGRTTDGTASGDAGCLPIANAATGGNFITRFEVASTVAQFFTLFDILWCNSGLVVTTTTSQTINSGTLPARDLNGATAGEGCMIALLFTAAATNAAAIANSTVTYTNSGGTGSRTATLAALVGAQIPATPTIGTLVLFQLAAGDKGVGSIQSIALNTSLVTGSVSLLIVRPLATYSAVVANVGAGPFEPMAPGIRIYNGTCAVLAYTASATTATTAIGSVVVQERAV